MGRHRFKYICEASSPTSSLSSGTLTRKGRRSGKGIRMGRSKNPGTQKSRVSYRKLATREPGSTWGRVITILLEKLWFLIANVHASMQHFSSEPFCWEKYTFRDFCKLAKNKRRNSGLAVSRLRGNEYRGRWNYMTKKKIKRFIVYEATVMLLLNIKRNYIYT